MKQFFLNLFLILICAGLFAACHTSSHHLYCPNIGLSITKPPGWHQLSDAEWLRNHAALKYDAEERGPFEARSGTPPLVAMTKYKEPYPKLNPSVVVRSWTFREQSNVEAVDLLHGLVVSISSNASNASLIQDAVQTVIAGREAARARMKMVVQGKNGLLHSTLDDLYLVPRTPDVFLITVSRPPDASAELEDEFRLILKSITIE